MAGAGDGTEAGVREGFAVGVRLGRGMPVVAVRVGRKERLSWSERLVAVAAVGTGSGSVRPCVPSHLR
ncbi:hypothetical protein OG799_10515 [Micromonospora sp. NBC_00898]|uniref:hypothetical protein n=1 Tax=Micromonospora sp. NBC_00898 TaxID=2975981 RepID=UPI00386D2F38|nr:hypothetical protein OG799_10515 [Micromonospora sp. NBC_00898]